NEDLIIVQAKHGQLSVLQALADRPTNNQPANNRIGEIILKTSDKLHEVTSPVVTNPEVTSHAVQTAVLHGHQKGAVAHLEINRFMGLATLTSVSG
ncbi:MAG: hypothetical protein ACI93R_003318, partial [Flavobacteriales bacterium]